MVIIGSNIEIKDLIFKIRKDNNLSQDQLADELFVSRQAVSRWESGLTTPNRKPQSSN
ncbi:helix-turn-helix domain-containing protein [Acholeplasma sp. OttesenSCG-928-E16]|nr:helix-turn-helix domain-containing protein [Acholeplasma sp. OttesenSCG-928-E16]